MEHRLSLVDTLYYPCCNRTAQDSSSKDQRQCQNSNRLREQLYRGEECRASDKGSDARALAKKSDDGSNALVAIVDYRDHDEDSVARSSVLLRTAEDCCPCSQTPELLQHAADTLMRLFKLRDDIVTIMNCHVVWNVGHKKLPGLFEGELSPILRNGGQGYCRGGLSIQVDTHLLE